MNKFVRLIDNNLVCVSGIEDVESVQDDACIFWTKKGIVKIFGANLEILKFELQNKMAVICGTIYDVVE